MSSNVKCLNCGLVNSNLLSCRRCNTPLAIAQPNSVQDQTGVNTNGTTSGSNIKLFIIATAVTLAVLLGFFVFMLLKDLIISLMALVVLISLPIILVVGVGYVIYTINKGTRRTIDQANAAYQQALLELRANPGNPMLRQKALEFGRYSCALSRKKGKVTIYDEMSIKNDIDAVSVNVGMYPPQPPVYPQPQFAPPYPSQAYPQSPPNFYNNQQIPQQAPQKPLTLAELENLKARGLINEQEYVLRKRAILGQQGQH